MSRFSFALISGGDGKRFGSDKTKALLNNKELYLYGLELGISLTDDVMHISRNKEKYKPFMKNVRYLEDEYPNQCPMAGIMTCLNNAKYDEVFVLSADSPLLNRDIIMYIYSFLNGYDTATPVINDKYYTLAAFYRTNMLNKLENFYNNKQYKLIETHRSFNNCYIDAKDNFFIFCNSKYFININNQQDLTYAKQILIEI